MARKRKHKKKDETIDGLNARHVAQIVRRKMITQVKEDKTKRIPRKRKHRGDFSLV